MKQQNQFAWRGYFVQVVFGVCALLLFVRALDLQVLDDGFLANQGEARFLRTADIPAHRGKITDRFGRPLAVSTPVDTIAANPKELAEISDLDFDGLAKVLGKGVEQLRREIDRAGDKEFMYLRRHLRPSQAAAVLNLELPSVRRIREYRRYYPAGEVSAHILGFTNIDDIGQEGLELAFDQWLSGTQGQKRVLKDRLGRTVKDVESIKPPHAGKDLEVSIDMRIQYLAYRELKSAVARLQARSGSVVVLDVNTNEVLAMVNRPSYNPNNRGDSPVAYFRNRAVTDIFEPGSSFKPLIIAAALESGIYLPKTKVDTSPGFLQVGLKTIPDTKDFGLIDVTGVLTNSSNVGAAKIALSLEPEYLWSTLARFGVGRLTDSGFPGESAGLLNHFDHWREINHATIAYGYGLTVSPMQLAQAY
ncbi:MAG: penicillin-binding transpeptidase domain-containing protein, partial [Pseudomonadota bacterium]